MNIDYHNESGDVLSDVLDTLQIEGQLYCVSEMNAPWAVKEGLRNLIFFYVIERGNGFIKFKSGREKITLAGGDLVVISHAGEHTIFNGSEAKPIVMNELFGEDSTDLHYLKYDGGGEATNFICGSFQFKNAMENSLIASLPQVLHIKANDHEIRHWLEPTLRLLSFEARNARQGTSSIISRLTGIIFVQAIRIWIDTRANEESGWLTALKDKQISAALNLLHQNPSENWTLPKIAAAIGMSRSPFAAKFTKLVGEPPLTYLKKWRMNLAAHYLQTESLNISEVAAKVGYKSEAAFSKTFKKHFGKPPRSFKKNIT